MNFILLVYFLYFLCSIFFFRWLKNIWDFCDLKWCLQNDIFYLFTEVINFHVKSLSRLHGSKLWRWLLFFRSLIVIWYSYILVTFNGKNGIFTNSYACLYYCKFFHIVVHRCQQPLFIGSNTHLNSLVFSWLKTH